MDTPTSRRASARSDPSLVCAGELNALAEKKHALDLRNSGVPAFLMSVPFYLSADVPNNFWMFELEPKERRIDQKKALSEFLVLYNYLSARSLVYLLPSQPRLQDQTFVANLGIVLPHESESTAVISRFRSKPRINESKAGLEFFKLLNFPVRIPPKFCDADSPSFVGQAGTRQADVRLYFEGEADLKYIRNNVYIGAHGIRTSHSALRWLARNYHMKIIPFGLNDERLFHLDCCVLRISGDQLVVCTKAAGKTTVREIEKHSDIFDVTLENAYYGITNCVVLDNKILYSSDIDVLSKSNKYYSGELSYVRSLENLCSRLRLEPRRFNLSEFCKSGGGLGCMTLHLNYNNYTDLRNGSLE